MARLWLSQVKLASSGVAVYYLALLLFVSGSLMAAIGMDTAVKGAIISEGLVPMFVAFVCINAFMIDHHCGTKDIVRSAIVQPSFLILLRASGSLLPGCILACVTAVIASIVADLEPVSLIVSAFLNTVGLSALGIGVATLLRSPTVAGVVVLVVVSASFLLGSSVSHNWQMLSNVFGISMMEALPVRVTQLALVIWTKLVLLLSYSRV